MAKAKGLTRRITRKQALSYEVTPNRARAKANPIGVTHLASVNGRKKGKLTGAALQRWRKAHPALVRNQFGSRGGVKRAKPASRRASAYVATRRVALRPNLSAREYEELYDKQMAEARAKKAAGAPRKAKKLTKAQKAARAAKIAKGRTAGRRAKFGRRYGPYKSLVAQVGVRRVPTFMHQSKRGKPEKIPLWAILGTKSKRDLERRVASDEKLARKVVAAKKSRERAAARLMAGGDIFTPNPAGGDEAMKARPNRYKKGKLKGARLTKWRRKHKALASAAACAKKVGKTAGRRKKAKRAKRNPTTTTAVTNRRRRRVHAKRAKRNGKLRGAKLAAWKRAHPGLVKQWGKGKSKSKKRRTTKKARRNPVTTAAVMNRRRRRARRNASPVTAVMNRRRRRHARRYPLARRNVGLVQSFKQNRHRRRRHAVRNPAMDILKIGAKATLGFVLHGVGTYIVDMGLSRIDAFKSGTLGNFRDAISGFVAALIGVPIANKVDRSNVASAGMIASEGRKVLLAVLKQFGASQYAGYLGEYYPSGLSEYIASPGMRGIGAYEYDPAYQGNLMQAQAGFGAPRFTQAAAAFGALPQFMQAAAGMGQPFTQAAAGMGYLGEYIPVNGVGAGPTMESDGIWPDMMSAERALSVAEAAAGIGRLGDIPTDPAYPEDLPQTSPPPYPFDLSQGDIWDATQVPAPPGDISQAMRDGILAGGQGIFG